MDLCISGGISLLSLLILSYYSKDKKSILDQIKKLKELSTFTPGQLLELFERTAGKADSARLEESNDLIKCKCFLEGYADTSQPLVLKPKNEKLIYVEGYRENLWQSLYNALQSNSIYNIYKDFSSRSTKFCRHFDMKDLHSATKCMVIPSSSTAIVHDLATQSKQSFINDMSTTKKSVMLFQTSLYKMLFSIWDISPHEIYVGYN